MRQVIIFWLFLVIFGLLLSIASAVYAEGDVIKPGTLPPAPEPKPIRVYLAIAMYQDADGGWMWPASR
jgi:hypothetical protein